MADLEARDQERRWRQAPGDPAALEGLIASLRRGGQRVPGALLERREWPARTFASELPLRVSCLLPAGLLREVGRTPGRVQLPRHRMLIVGPRDPAGTRGVALRSLLAEARQARLPGLDLRQAPLTNDDLAPLREHEALAWLNLSGCTALTGPALMALAGLPELLALDLSAGGRISGGLRYLSETPLRRLDLSELELTPAGREGLLGLRELSALALPCAPLDPGLLADLSALPELSELALRRGRFPEDGLIGLPALVGLRRLELSWSEVREADLERVAALPALEALDLSFARGVSAAGLERLAGATALRELRLYGCAQLGNEVVRALEGLAGLRLLDLTHTGLTRTRLNALRKALPDCQVVAVDPPVRPKR